MTAIDVRFPSFRRFVSGALLATAAVAGCECGPPIQEGFPVFSVNPSSVDFGTVCIQDTREQQFSIRNDGSVGLQVTKSELKGGAFSLVEPIPEFVGPLGEHVVTVRFDATAVEAQNGSIIIETDDPENPKRTVTLLGEGFDGERFELKASCERKEGESFSTACAALNFSDAQNNGVTAGTTRDRVLRVTNEGCAEVTVYEVEFFPDADNEGTAADAAMFRVVSPAVPFTLKGSETKDVTVRFSPPAGEAVYPYAKMRVRSSDPVWGTKEYGLLAYSVAPALLVEPASLTFYDAVQGEPRTKTFSIRNTGTATLTVNTVDLQQQGTTDYALDFEGAAPPFNLPFAVSRDIKVVYTSTGSGTDRAKVVVTAAGSEPQSVELFGGTAPVLDVTWSETVGGASKPVPVDFGTYDPGPSCTIPTVTRHVTLKNNGNAVLEVTRIALPAAENRGGGFKLVGATPANVPPGGTLEFSAEFKDSLGLTNDGAKLEITTNDPVDAVIGGRRVVDFVSQNQPNLPPTAVIDVPPGAGVGRELKVSGLRSFDPTAGDVLTYAWSIVPGSLNPASSTIRLESATDAETRIISNGGAFPDVAAEFRLQLVVTDQCSQASTPSRVFVKIGQ